ncbi:MAG: winged helix-turn-helix domain-containing protein, partial [Thermoanaerobaculia bacterium]|nr:winged helix-turn-helix domain-containing protein [Thermoanaerobaculia bacterium]
MPQEARFAFGLFEVDGVTGELVREGRPVSLQEKPGQVLLALLERPGQLVTRESLFRRLWSEGTFVEFDTNLNAAVLKLRQALGDDASNPRFVETVVGRGYRFIAPVRRLPAGAGSPEPVRRLPPAIGYISGGLLVVVLLAWAGARWLDWRQQAPRVVSTTRLTADPGLDDTPSWSPDGSRVAYASDRLGQMDIWVRQVGTGDPVVLTHDHAGYDGNPAWSPDGERIAFASDREGGGIFVMTSLGGHPRHLVELSVVPAVEVTASVPTLAWSPDSTRLAFAVGLGAERRLAVVESETGATRDLELAAEISALA